MKVGLLLENTIDEQGWNSKGYKGLLNIHTKMGIDVMFKEDVNTMAEIEDAIKQFEKEGVRLLFGHGHIFAEAFTEVAKNYPSIHFVSFNGEVEGENVTNVSFNSYSMGFFAGIVAAAMSKTENIGVIAAYPWQEEIAGFQNGAKTVNKNVKTHVEYVHSWIDEEKAKDYFYTLVSEDVDVFYPTGDGYHLSIIEEAKEAGLFVIGFVSDPSDLGSSTVLTSTLQHVDEIYEQIARQYVNGELEAGNVRFDFKDEVVSLGQFSPEIPHEIVQQIENAVDYYVETGQLPTGRMIGDLAFQ